MKLLLLCLAIPLTLGAAFSSQNYKTHFRADVERLIVPDGIRGQIGRCVLTYGRYEDHRKNSRTQRVELERTVYENGTITVSARPLRVEIRSEKREDADVYVYDVVIKVRGVGHYLAYSTTPTDPAFGFVPELRSVTLVHNTTGRGYYVDSDGGNCLSRLLDGVAEVH